MDPCPFVRILVANLALKIPSASKSTSSIVHPSSCTCFCEIRLNKFPLQTAIVPFVEQHSQLADGLTQTLAAASFHLSKADLEKLSVKHFARSSLCLKIAIYIGRRATSCGLNFGHLLGRVLVPINLSQTETKPSVFHNGWIPVGKDSKGSSSAQFHVNVRSEPDPRFVFQFDGEPECSPQVFQIKGSLRQPIFTCKFSLRNAIVDRGHKSSRSLPSEPSTSWLRFGSDRERPGKERKGWSLTVHDLSGSPVATASMLTPFVASPGTDRVSRSNPGSWLILRIAKPWGRLEAWRERCGTSDALGYRFELIPDADCMGMGAPSGIVLAESVISSAKGGKFVIDLGTTPVSVGFSSPGRSEEFGVWRYCSCRGFVMGAEVEGEGKCSKPIVEIGVQHVMCMEDAATFVALAAAIDLSMDACRLFTQRLRKELC